MHFCDSSASAAHAGSAGISSLGSCSSQRRHQAARPEARNRSCRSAARNSCTYSPAAHGSAFERACTKSIWVNHPGSSRSTTRSRNA